IFYKMNVRFFPPALLSLHSTGDIMARGHPARKKSLNVAETSGSSSQAVGIAKSATGIAGLDEILGGGLPTGRPTLVSGHAGCGKTMLGMEFLVRGATQFDEPGVFVSFEESAADLSTNVRSLGFDLDVLSAQKKILLDHVQIERGEIEETGEYDL